MEDVEFAVGMGAGGRVLLGHDVCTQIQLVRNGGKGYAHVLENIVPRLRKRAMPERQVKAMLTDNPQRALTFR
jgi:phosphotriesterase-related protein